MDNLGYKIIALLISLILWLTVLGRRDFVVSKDIEVEFIPKSPSYYIGGQTADTVKVKVAGPRVALRDFEKSSKLLSIDVLEEQEGFVDVEISPSRIYIPQGVRLLSIRPSRVRVELQKRK